MTIFFEIVKAIVIEKLDEEKHRSQRKDEKSLVRNTEVSKAKQKATKTAIESIQNMVCLPEDKENFEALSAIIDTCQTEAKKKSDEYNLDEGKHGPEMIRIGAMLAGIYRRFKALKLLNIELERSFEMVLVSIDPEREVDLAYLEKICMANQKPVLLCQEEAFSVYGFCGKTALIRLDNNNFSHLKFPEGDEVTCLDNLQVTKEMRQEILRVTNVPARDPYTIYRYNVACFIANIVMRQHYPVKDIPRLKAEKENAALEALKSCEASLSWLDSKIPEYLDARKDVVLASLEKLEKKNIELCKSFEVAPKFPFSVSFFAQANVDLGTFTPETGFLGECITKAMTEIDPCLKEKKHPVETGYFSGLASLLS